MDFREIEQQIAQENIQTATQLIEKLSEGQTQFNILYRADISRLEGKYNVSLDLCDQILNIKEEISNSEAFVAKTIKAYTLFRIAKAQESDKLVLDCEWIYESMTDEERSRCIYYYGKLIHLKGNLFLEKSFQLDAIKNFEKAIEVFESSNYISAKVGSLLNIGNVYTNLGQTEKGREYLEAARTIHNQQTEHSTRLSYWINLQLGINYVQGGEYDSGVQFFEEAIKLAQMLDNQLLEGTPILNLMWYYLRVDKRDLAKPYLDKYLEIAEKYDTTETRLSSKLAKAVYLKTSNKVKQIIEAQKILEELITIDDQYTSRFSVLASIFLIEILLDELKSYGEEEIFGQILELTEKLQHEAEIHHSINLNIPVLLLQSKLALVNGNIIESNKMLEQAEKLAKDNKINLHMIAIQKEKDKMRTEMAKWEEIIHKGASIKEKMDLIHYQEYIENAKKVVGRA